MYAVYVCVFSSHSFWTSSSLDVPAGVTQEEGHTGFLIYLLSAVRAMVLKKRNSYKCTAAHRDTWGTRWASGDAQTLAEPQSPADIHRCSNAVFKIANSNKDVTLCGLQATLKPTLLLPQNCSKGGAGERGIFVCGNTTYYTYSECFLLKKD